MRIGFWGGPRHKEIAEIAEPLRWSFDGYELHNINLAFRQGLSCAQVYIPMGHGSIIDRGAVGKFLTENGLQGKVITHAEHTAAQLRFFGLLANRS